jgi:hypothetical protein
MTLSKVRDLVIIGAVALAVVVGAIVGIAHLTASHPSAVERACRAQQADIQRLITEHSPAGHPPLTKAQTNRLVQACVTNTAPGQ